MLFSILFILFLGVLFILLFARNLLYAILGTFKDFWDVLKSKFGKKRKKVTRTEVRHSDRKGEKKKIYSDSDGEYVEYEEVK